MSPRTRFTEILQATGWSLREWERRSGVSLNTLRAISGGRSARPQKRTRAALASALRQSSQDFERLADALDTE